MGRTPHTATARGRIVRVKLKTGEVFEARFMEKTAGKVLVFEGGRRVAVGEIQSMSDRRLLQPIGRHRK
jgi:hypothetical protein